MVMKQMFWHRIYIGTVIRNVQCIHGKMPLVFYDGNRIFYVGVASIQLYYSVLASAILLKQWYYYSLGSEIEYENGYSSPTVFEVGI